MATETDKRVYRALSLGAGVQSSVLALLLSQSDSRLLELGYPKPDVAVFADTGWEPDYVYDHLEWLEGQLDYPLVRVSSGNIRTNLHKGLRCQATDLWMFRSFWWTRTARRGCYDANALTITR